MTSDPQVEAVRRRRRPEILFVALALLAVVVTVALYLANYSYSVNNPGGSDLLPRWLGTRKFLMEGVSPYSEETTREIQQAFYGRTAGDDEDPVYFVYPLYSIVVFGPFAMIPDFNTARAVWMTVLEISLVLLAAASLALTRWRISPLMLAVLLIFTALWYYSLRVFIYANVSLIVALLVAAAFLAVRWEHDALAGLLFALSTIKPQMVVLLIGFVLVWSFSTRRMVLFWSTLGNIALFSALAALFIPNWIWQNFVQIYAYREYTQATTTGEFLALWMPGVGDRLGWAVTIIVAATLIWEWRRAWGQDDPRWFIWTACLTLVLTKFIGIPTATENYMILFPALVMVFTAWEEQWGSLGRWLVAGSMVLLFFGVYALFLLTVDLSGPQPVQAPILFFPLPLFLVGALYWVRWWILRPERPLMDRWRRFRRTG